MKLGPKGFFKRVNPENYNIEYKLYDTIILIHNTNTGEFTLNSGGWKTNHTKKCLNLILMPYGVKVSQVKNKWYVSKLDNKTEFKDNMIINRNLEELTLKEAN